MRGRPLASEPARETEGVRQLRLRKQEFVRDAVWAAAIDLFARKGFDETTVDDIVAAAGTSRRSFFRFFESKSDLLARPMVVFGEMLGETIERCEPSFSASALVRTAVLQAVRSAVSNDRTRELIDVVSRCPAARAAQLTRTGEVEDRVAEAFARRQGRRRDILQARALAALTLSTVNVACRHWFENGDDTDVERAVERALAAVAEAGRRPRARRAR